MKRFIVLISLLAVPLARGQEPTAASLPQIAENYRVLQGQVQDLTDRNAALERKVADLQGKLDALNAQQGKASGDAASQDDLKSLKAAIEEEDKKRLADNEEVLKELKLIAKASKSGAVPATPAHTTAMDVPPAASKPDTVVTDAKHDGPGFTYEVKPNDTPMKIARKLLDEKGVKVTADQIMAANPQVKDPTKLYIGEKLFIPAPKDGMDTASR